MSWVRIDDAMPDSLKIAPLSDAAFRAYVTSICYCARSLTDGLVPTKKAKEFAGKARVVQELVPALWEPVDAGFMVHDYLSYNPTRATVLAERDKAKDRMRAARSEDVRPNNDGTNGGSSPSPAPTRPNPDPLPDPNPLLLAAKGVWENKIGMLPWSFKAEFEEVVTQVPNEWFETAVEITRYEATKPNWRFCKAVLDNALASNTPPRRKNDPAPMPLSLSEIRARSKTKSRSR